EEGDGAAGCQVQRVEPKGDIPLVVRLFRLLTVTVDPPEDIVRLDVRRMPLQTADANPTRDVQPPLCPVEIGEGHEREAARIPCDLLLQAAYAWLQVLDHSPASFRAERSCSSPFDIRSAVSR